MYVDFSVGGRDAVLAAGSIGIVVDWVGALGVSYEAIRIWQYLYSKYTYLSYPELNDTEMTTTVYLPTYQLPFRGY